MKAPDFALPDQFDKIHSLKDYQGQWLVVYFYPKDDTPVCTREACNFRDNYAAIKKMGAEVVGISKDSTKSHSKFALKHELNFSILSDIETTTIKAFGAWGRKKFMGREFDGILRNTYIVNPQGEIVKEYKVDDADSHTQDVLSDLKLLMTN